MSESLLIVTAQTIRIRDMLFGDPVMGGFSVGARWSVYRLHLDSPIAFTQSIRVTIEQRKAIQR
jgi:hypothetical protein